MTNFINLQDAAKFYKELEHQKKAFDYLASLLTPAELTKFAELYRTPIPDKVSLPKDRLKLLSQWDNLGDLNKDGRADSIQTCGVTSVAMAINAYNNLNIHPQVLDKLIVNKAGSRYSWANLVWCLNQYKLDSKFSTSTTLANIVNHLKSGNLVLWSNKLTHSGHIVLLADYNSAKSVFKVYDPFGEPMVTTSGVRYDTSSKNGATYWLSLASFKRFSMNGSTSSGHWAALITK